MMSFCYIQRVLVHVLVLIPWKIWHSLVQNQIPRLESPPLIPFLVAVVAVAADWKMG